MVLSIKDQDTDALARKLAGVTGESLTLAVRRALEERLERECRRQRNSGLAETLLGIGKRCAAHVDAEARSVDHGAMLYDELGLPR